MAETTEANVMKWREISGERNKRARYRERWCTWYIRCLSNAWIRIRYTESIQFIWYMPNMSKRSSKLARIPPPPIQFPIDDEFASFPYALQLASILHSANHNILFWLEQKSSHDPKYRPFDNYLRIQWTSRSRCIGMFALNCFVATGTFAFLAYTSWCPINLKRYWRF